MAVGPPLPPLLLAARGLGDGVVVWIIVAAVIVRAVLAALKRPPSPEAPRRPVPDGGSHEPLPEPERGATHRRAPPPRAPPPPPRAPTARAPRRPAEAPVRAREHAPKRLTELDDAPTPLDHIHTTHEHLADLDRTRIQTVAHLGAAPASVPGAPRRRAPAGRALLALPADATPRDRLRSALVWSEILGRPRAHRRGVRR